MKRPTVHESSRDDLIIYRAHVGKTSMPDSRISRQAPLTYTLTSAKNSSPEFVKDSIN
ncbi:hypothetical protein [Nibricoccus aquaticus]|uniref:hypothetical protein n=1 Tax=Nibricoccus aquaticus TaxID=2576891 RepID=UPI001585F2FE|nr:hypothetical protein [Nibricoccus aquaticus]